MSRRGPPGVVSGDTPDDIESQFYEALQRGELERLMTLWADDDDIVCVHPGGVRAIGAAAIRATFEAILASGGLRVLPQQVHRLQQIGSALHHLVECIEVEGAGGVQRGWVLATNFYVKTAQGWRMAAHHASPGQPEPPVTPIGDPPSTLH